MIGRNNPLNIRYNPMNRWQGSSGRTKGFCNFRDIRYGIRAAMKILVNYDRYGALTYEDKIKRFAPPFENPTSSYVNYICRKCCVLPSDEPESIEEYATMIYYMWCFEQGSKNPPTLTIAEIEEIISDEIFMAV